MDLNEEGSQLTRGAYVLIGTQLLILITSAVLEICYTTGMALRSAFISVPILFLILAAPIAHVPLIFKRFSLVVSVKYK